MNFKKIFVNGLFVGALIAVIALIPDAGDHLLSWLFPPRIYILIGVAVLLVLWKILIELRNRNNGDDNE